MRSIAPGKLLLTGEYAVLEGAPGLVMAVNRHARVTLGEPQGACSTVRALQADCSSASLSFDHQGDPCWNDAQARQSFALVDALLRQRKDLGLACIRGFDAQLDTREFFSQQGGGGKLGLGSSAALTVALALALRHWADAAPLSPTELLPGLLRVHRHFQGGRGSGIDLAASLLGGVVEYRSGPGDIPRWRHRQLPTQLSMRMVWTGRGASTADFLATLHRARRDHPEGWQPVRQRLVQGAERAARALGDLDDFLLAVAACAEDLRALGEFAGLDVYSTEHQQLARLAARSGVTYKPSGAGGGDLGLALSADQEKLEHFCQASLQAGFHCPKLLLEIRGAHLESPD
jgi:phosphomevalonate kinase